MTDPKAAREYTTEEAASIITRVLDRHNEGGRISHDELLESVRDIGVTTLELEEAVVAETRLRAERLVREEERQRALRKLLRHLATFAVLGPACAVVDLRVTRGTWYFWVLLGWGVVLALHAVRVLLPTEEDRRLAAAEEKSVEARNGRLEIKDPPAG